MKIGVVSEGELDHLTRVVDRLVFVQFIEPFQILTFLVANDRLFHLLLVLPCPTESHRLTMPAIAFDQDLCLTGKVLTSLTQMA